ncbi:MAG TPA: hypothetical protein VJP85_04215 [Candidatus Baltobacteraceae bacterium]|nr:hypothetical protein [Candidatus Baltobacteraceae bacterium]
MIPDLVNAALGIALIYVAILRQPFLHGTGGSAVEALAGITIALLAAAALKTREAWYSRVMIPLGIALAVFALPASVFALSVTLESWFVFWIGVFTGVVALWGALYPHNLQEQSP